MSGCGPERELIAALSWGSFSPQRVPQPGLSDRAGWLPAQPWLAQPMTGILSGDDLSPHHHRPLTAAATLSWETLATGALGLPRATCCVVGI